jgi:hypothetical protein
MVRLRRGVARLLVCGNAQLNCWLASAIGTWRSRRVTQGIARYFTDPKRPTATGPAR